MTPITTALQSLAERVQLRTPAVDEENRGVLSYISVQSRQGSVAGEGTKE